MSRRFFIKILLSLGLGAYFPGLAKAAAIEENFHTPHDGYKILSGLKFFRQIVTPDSRTSRTLMWYSERELDDAKIEYFPVGGSALFAKVFCEKYFPDDSTTFIYSCTLENLKPESVYCFRIISGERATALQKFFTPGFGNFQMLIFSDSQCVNYDVWKKTADTAAKNFPDAELVTVIGDLVDNGLAAYQWRHWHKAAEKVLSGRIFVPVCGNHECYDLKWLNCLPTGYLQNFKLPSNDTKKFDGYFYSFDYGPAHFSVLNTQFLEIDDLQPGLREEQEYFLRRDIANVNRNWKIVLMHKDIFDYGQNKFNDIAEIFMNLFDELEIDLVLTGHLHTYRNRGKIFAMKKSGSGPAYILCGRAGDQDYIEPVSEIDDVTAPDIPNEPESYITLDVSPEKLILTCRSVEGEIWDKFVLQKNQPS